MKATAYWCLLTIHWMANGREGNVTVEGEYYVRRRGTTVREVFHEFQQKASEGLPGHAKASVVCWDMQPLKLRQRRWWQRGDRVSPTASPML